MTNLIHKLSTNLTKGLTKDLMKHKQAFNKYLKLCI